MTFSHVPVALATSAFVTPGSSASNVFHDTATAWVDMRVTPYVELSEHISFDVEALDSFCHGDLSGNIDKFRL